MKTIEQKRKEKLDEIDLLKKEIADKTERLDRLLGFSDEKPTFDELPSGNYSDEVYDIFKENPNKKMDSIEVTELLNKKHSLNLDKGKVYSAMHYLKGKDKIVKSDRAGYCILK